MKKIIFSLNNYFILTVSLVCLCFSLNCSKKKNEKKSVYPQKKSYSITNPTNVVRLTTGEYPPYASQKIKNYGKILHTISEAFKEVGYTVEYDFFPWKRAFHEGQNPAKFHGSAFWFPSEERKKSYYYSDAIYIENYVFFHLKTFAMKDWITLSDLKGLRIGATAGYTYSQEFWKLAEKKILSVEIVNTDIQNFRKLLFGRIDIFPLDKTVAYSLLYKNYDTNTINSITYHPKSLRKMTSHLLFNKNKKDNESLMQLFNKGMQKIRQSGRYKEILNEVTY